ncbi:MAG: DUF1080 domain-containing protein [Pirellulaceae bacterium]
MRIVCLATLSLVALCLFPVSNVRAADKPLNTPPEGFVALFNGKDLTGWKGLVGNPKTRAVMPKEELAQKQAEADKRAHEHWSVQDGILVYSGKGKISLCTAKDYANFELYTDWKIKEAGDSGIYLRGTPQVQIWDPFTNPNTKNGEEKGSGSLWNNKKNPRFPNVMADHPIGEWNTFHIKMVGEKVTIHLNDKLIVDNVTLENYWEPEKPIYPSEQIELQDHGNTLYFRNLYIKELPAE